MSKYQYGAYVEYGDAPHSTISYLNITDITITISEDVFIDENRNRFKISKELNIANSKKVFNY